MLSQDDFQHCCNFPNLDFGENVGPIPTVIKLQMYRGKQFIPRSGFRNFRPVLDPNLQCRNASSSYSTSVHFVTSCTLELTALSL